MMRMEEGRVEAQGVGRPIVLPPRFNDVVRALLKTKIVFTRLVSEGDRTWGRAFNIDRTAMAEVSFPRFLPEGVWEVDYEELDKALKQGGALEVAGDRIVAKLSSGNVVEVGKRIEEFNLPPAVRENVFTAEALVDAELFKAITQTGYEHRKNVVGLRMTPEGIAVGIWDNWGEGAVFKLPGRHISSFSGSGTTYVMQSDLRNMLIPGVKVVKMRWGENAPLEVSYSVDGVSVKMWVAPLLKLDELEKEYKISWDMQPPGEAAGSIEEEDYKLLQRPWKSDMKIDNVMLINGIFTVKLHGDTTYCAKTSINLPGRWEIHRFPNLDLYFLSYGKAPLYVEQYITSYYKGLDLYAGGWKIGYKYGEEKAEDVKCPDVVGPPLPRSLVSAMKNASRTILKNDGIYIRPRLQSEAIQIAKARLNLPSDREVIIMRSELEMLHGSTWRLGITPDGKVIIDAGKEKLITS